MYPDVMNKLERDLHEHFTIIMREQSIIKKKLSLFADNKKLKGDEIVGWLGEIYGKLFFAGSLVNDSFEHDFETSSGFRISVKTRKGIGRGWNVTSAIPSIKEGKDCPTHLLFIHLNEDYTVDKMWFYPWSELLENNRFTTKTVRGKFRSYIFKVKIRDDDNYIIYG